MKRPIRIVVLNLRTMDGAKHRTPRTEARSTDKYFWESRYLPILSAIKMVRIDLQFCHGAEGVFMGLRYYTLTVKTSPKSATAFGLNARCDEDAVGKAMMVLKKLDAFCDHPLFQMVRADGTIVQGLVRQSMAR